MAIARGRFRAPLRKPVLMPIRLAPDLHVSVGQELPLSRGSRSPLSVLRPRLPTAAQIAPYLLAIDETRLYSNGGPLSLKLQARLSRHLRCPEDQLIATASGTSGITAALLALELSKSDLSADALPEDELPTNSLCLMPSWTFAATPHAALSAGLQPWFVDVDQQTWALDPVLVRKAIARSGTPPKAVIVVSPFGAPIQYTAWQDFQQQTGIPVIADAAAAFDTVRPSGIISVVSLHATKIFAAGEGGLVIAPSAHLRDRIRACGNFGFDGTRSARYPSINAKMSEYHAAVALANFDLWPATRLRHLQIAAWYKKALHAVPHIQLQPAYGAGWAAGTTSILLESDSAESIARYLLREGIETRMWWGAGCHVQPAFARCPVDKLPVTEYLGMRVLGLPHFVDMQKADVTRVANTLSKALRSRASGRRGAALPAV